MTIDLDDLEARAKAATPGPWDVRWTVGNPDWPVVIADGYGPVPDVRTNAYMNPADAEFIAAANPAVVLELIDRLRAAESALFRVAGYVRVASERVRRGIDGTSYPEVARPGWEPEGEASDD